MLLAHTYSVGRVSVIRCIIDATCCVYVCLLGLLQPTKFSQFDEFLELDHRSYCTVALHMSHIIDPPMYIIHHTCTTLQESLV